MAKRNVFLHVGPDVPGVESPHDALLANPVLEAARVRVPSVTARDLELAVHDLRRTHREAGLRRKEVEGQWARVCRKAFKARADVVIAAPGLAGATDEQMALALDGLAGLRLHVVVTPESAGGLPLASVGTWATAVAAKGRLHVLPVGAGSEPEAFADEMAHLAVRAAEAEVERRLAKLLRHRRRLARRLARVDAA